jgi:ribosomal protein S18 acetylase RimI-like enzyme
VSRRLAKFVRELRDLPVDVAQQWRLEGWRGVLAELRERTVNRIWRHGRFIVFAQPTDDVRPASVPAGVEIRPVEEADWFALAEIVPRAKLARFRSWHERGRVMIVARRGELAVGYTWYSDRMEPDVEFYDLGLPPGAIYAWALYVIPAERNSGVGSALVGARLEHARAHGYRSCWRMVSVRNPAAQRTVAKSAASRSESLRRGELVWTKFLSRSRTTFVPDPEPAPDPDPAP